MSVFSRLIAVDSRAIRHRLREADVEALPKDRKRWTNLSRRYRPNFDHKIKIARAAAGIEARNEEARTVEAGFCWERRYAKLGHLLPMFYIEQAVDPVCRPSLIYLNYSIRPQEGKRIVPAEDHLFICGPPTS